MFYSSSTGGFYSVEVHGNTMPSDVTPEHAWRFTYAELIAGQSQGMCIKSDASGFPVLVDPPRTAPSAASLCMLIDTAADAARRAVAGDPLRAVEYDRARLEAEVFAAADYQGEVPRTVAAWAINGRTARQAADSILAEAATYTEALYTLRETRLQAKEQIRAAFAAGNLELAEDIAAETVAAIEAAVQGVGNANA
ncbi:phage tail protein [Pseudomonas tohonis]|nr:phage tail protein [Pseudomonas tohonis]